ncbi:MAG: tyrosine-type recombinase/integrase [Bacteroidales bacterium]|nr:tyrosine-type recombinase/integrase [Bacteroidales bacterium]
MSPRTREIYTRFFYEFLEHHKDKQVEDLSFKELYRYVSERTDNLNETQSKQCIAAVKFFYEKVLGRPKMFFKLREKTEVNLSKVNIPFYQLRNMCDKINSPTDSLLLMLYYYVNLHDEKICQLQYEEDSFLRIPQIENDKYIFEYLADLVEKHKQNLNNRTYLFENGGNQITVTLLYNKVHSIISRYKLKDIVFQQIGHYLDSTDFAGQTKSTYRGMLMHFFKHFGYKDPMKISDAEIRGYLNQVKHRSEAFQDSTISALRFFYEGVYGRKLPVTHAIRPRKGHYLPEIFSREEIEAMIVNEDNIKHKLIIAIAYCGGLRRSELINLRIGDIDFKRNVMFVHSAKGRKDRYTLLDPKLRGLVKEYLETYKPKFYFFEGNRPGTRYSAESVNRVLKGLAESAGIRRRVHVHMLRHSFGTHLLEDKHDIRYVQDLMGHINLSTTQRYTHITNHALSQIRSPLSHINLTKPREKKDEDRKPP